MADKTDKTETDIRLLDESIEHWRRMRDDPEGGEMPHGSDCPLCREYHPDGKSRCSGCPLFEHTGGESCQGTPYGNALTAFQRLSGLANPERALANWQAAADKEIAFLEGLRDKLSKQAK
jgi:hypothetical protein